MATEQRGLVIGSNVAGSDLSGLQYRYVRQDGTTANTVNGTTAATQQPIGVLQNKPTAGQPAEIMVTGITKMVAGAAVATGVRVMSDSTGRAILAATNSGANFSFGISQSAASAAGQIIEVLIPESTQL